MATQRKALGRGLSALMGTAEPDVEQPREIDIERIVPNSRQPRQNFNEDSLNDLADSIRVHGVVQPLVVRPLPDGSFQLIAGERRWRAAQRAGLTRVPVVVRETGDHAALEIALIENLQREDLNPMEEAHAYERLLVDFGLTQEEVSARVGKNRATVANTLRLLRLPTPVQQHVRDGQLTAGHAKALLSLISPDEICACATKMIQGQYSVRQAEILVSRQGKDGDRATTGEPKSLDPNVKAAIRTLEQALGTKVSIQESGGKGKIELHFFSAEELHRLYEGLLRVRF